MEISNVAEYQMRKRRTMRENTCRTVRLNVGASHGNVNSMLIRTSFGGIRSWSSHDQAALVKYANNRKVWLNLRDAFPHPYTESSAAAFLEMVARQSPTTYFAIATPEEAIGGIGISLHQDVHRLSAEMGYWLGEPYWGKGVMTEAVAKFTEYAFEHFHAGANLCRAVRQQSPFLPGVGEGRVRAGGPVAQQRDQGRPDTGSILVRTDQDISSSHKGSFVQRVPAKPLPIPLAEPKARTT